MRSFALTVFAIHTLFELAFGASIFLAGASSSATPDMVAAQPVAITISFRFMGSALIALGVLGGLVIFGPGVASVTARVIAVGLATFHALGTAGSLFTASPTFEAYTSPLALGAVVLHGVLALGFVVIAFARPAS
ncbi:MAG: hypothetical protein AAFQ64_20150 [Pseudomonadota bacterium]